MINRILGILCISTLLPVMALSQGVYSNPETRYMNGVRIQSYAGDGVEIASYAMRKSGYGLSKETSIVFVIKNTGDGVIDVNPSLVSAYYVDKNKNEKGLKIYSYEEYLKKAKRNILWFGPDNAEKATARTEVKNASGQIVSTVETKAETYIGANKDAQLNAETDISKTYLKRNTLDANQMMNGTMIVQSPKGKVFYAKIEIKGIVYLFEYEL